MADATTSAAVSQETPYDRATEINAVSFLVRGMLARLNVMKPVQVVAVHPGDGSPPAAGTVDVQLLISQVDGIGNAVQGSAGVVYRLPYFRLQGGPWAVVIDPAADDYGIIICADRDISKIPPTIASDGSFPVVPGSFRRNDLSDGIFFPCPFTSDVPDATAWFRDDGTLRITDGEGNVLETSSSGFALTGNVAVTGNITATGSIQAGHGTPDSVGLQTHTHPSNGAPPTPGT